MPKFYIEKGPFKVRFVSGEPMTEAAEGDVAELTDEQVEHWYVQAAAVDGRIVEVSDLEEGDGDVGGREAQGEGEGDDDPQAQLHLVQRSELEATEALLTAETQARQRAEDELAQEVEAHNETKAKLAALESQPPNDGGPVQVPDDVESRMLAVFPKLTDADFKTDGAPKVKAVEGLLGEDVTADQVALAWNVYQDGQE